VDEERFSAAFGHVVVAFEQAPASDYCGLEPKLLLHQSSYFTSTDSLIDLIPVCGSSTETDLLMGV